MRSLCPNSALPGQAHGLPSFPTKDLLTPFPGDHRC